MPWKDPEKRSAYFREYHSRPEVKKRVQKYLNKPEIKEHRKKWAKEYMQRPEIKAHRKAYLEQPDIKARDKKVKSEWNRQYYQTPEGKKRVYQYNHRPDVQKHRSEYWKRPDISAKRKEYQRRNKLRRFNMTHNTNLTEEQYKNMWLIQNESCAICCSKTPNDYGVDWHIDHDHITKRIRGILCVKCNANLLGSYESIPKTERIRLNIASPRIEAYLEGTLYKPQLEPMVNI